MLLKLYYLNYVNNKYNFFYYNVIGPIIYDNITWSL
jgi:hypothetical protein